MFNHWPDGLSSSVTAIQYAAMPLTSASKSSACPSTTPCARSPAHKTAAGVVTLRRQSGQYPGKSRKTDFTMAVWKSTGKTVSYYASAVKNLEAHQEYKNDRPCHTCTTRAWLFGYKIRRQHGQTPKTLRRQIGLFYDARSEE